MRWSILLVLSLMFPGCAVTSHDTRPSPLGTPRSSADLETLLDQPGPIELETIAAQDWEVERGGLINLEHPTAKAAGLKEGLEPIQVYFHVLRHPEHGTYLVDTAFEKALRDDPENAAIRGAVAKALKPGSMKFNQPLGDWLKQESQPVRGVFLTHLHMDHIAGTPDLPAGTALFSGPRETSARAFLNLLLKGTNDRLLEGKPPIGEWAFTADPAGRFEGVVDIFGDGSVWALWVPGHTPGSTAYLVRSTKGPVLLTGDACHTRWGWEQGVEPGTFSSDQPRSAESLKRMRTLVKDHPSIDVRPGHQR